MNKLADVKLVVTDMDGTLLNSEGKVSNDFFELFDELKEHKVHFVAASGRPYHSIKTKLKSIEDDIFFVAENGAIALNGEEELFTVNLSKERVNELIPLIRTLDDVYIVLCGKKSAYIETNEMSFVSMFNEYYAIYEIVEDLTKVVEDEFFKIAIYHFECSEKFIYPSVKHLEKELQVKVSGENWVDIAHPEANKGNALRFIQNMLGLSKEETMVFGDYNNDLEMLDEAHFSYAMENAHISVKNKARFLTKNNDERGVEFVLEKLVEAVKFNKLRK